MERGGGAVNQKTRQVVDNCLGWIRRAVYPPACVFCNLPTGKDDLCTGCAGDLAKNTIACSVCALPLQNPFDRICGQCQQKPPHFDQSIAPYLYEYPLDRLIQRFKFRGDLRCGRILAGLLLDSLQQTSVAIEAQALIPVPLHRRRLFERGFNQSRELARDIGKGLGLPLLDNQLTRVRNTRAQSELDAGRRHANVRGAFAVQSSIKLPSRIALIDDVMTTGSTVNECALCLKNAGVDQVSIWIIARAG
jgi:ComF family protein